MVAPLWIVRYPPLLDYPNHLASAFVIQHLHDPAYRFAEFYSASWHAYPNLLMTALFLAFGSVLPMEVAGRIVLTICVAALPLSGWWFLRVVNPPEQRQAVWALLLAYNPMFLRGFINYQLSISVCLCLLAVWLPACAPATEAERNSGERVQRSGRFFAAMALAILLYFTHLGGFVVAAAALTVYCAAHGRWRGLALSWLLFVPGALFYFSIPQAIQPIRAATYFYRLDEKLEYLGTPFVGYNTALDFACSLLALVGLVFCWVRNRELRVDRGWLAVAAVLLGIFWFAPADPGASEANRRLMPFVLLFVLAAARLGEKGRALVAIGVVVFGLRFADTTAHFVGAQARLRAMAQAFEATPPNARVVTLIENWRDPEYVRDGYYHVWAYGVIRRGWLAPSLFARPEIHVLRLHGGVYAPRDRTGYPYMSNPDWEAIRRDYDFVWAFGVPEFDEQLRKLGPAVVRDGEFALIRVTR